MSNTFNHAGLDLEEMAAQPYPNMRISAGNIVSGYVEGHEQNSVYLRITSDDVPDTLLLLRLDEAAAIVYVLGGTLYAQTVAMVEPDEVTS